MPRNSVAKQANVHDRQDCHFSAIPERFNAVTRILKADAQGVAAAAEVLAAGGLVAFPTETVYGLGADASNPTAVARIYAAKGRPAFNPLIAHVSDVAAAQREAALSTKALALAAHFWPGPLTLVAPVAPTGCVCDLARAGLSSVALRAPAHPAAQALLAAFGRPVAAPSANRSGHVSPVTAQHVAADLSGKVDLILDGGRTPAGLESTIVSFTGSEPTLLRPGALPRADIEAMLGAHLAAPTSAAIVAPGMTAAHYAPAAYLRIDAESLAQDEYGLDFGGQLSAHAPAGRIVCDLSPAGDMIEAAANLFAALRDIDVRGLTKIAVAPIPDEGIGEAINDRLQRAAVR